MALGKVWEDIQARLDRIEKALRMIVEVKDKLDALVDAGVLGAVQGPQQASVDAEGKTTRGTDKRSSERPAQSAGATGNDGKAASEQTSTSSTQERKA